MKYSLTWLHDQLVNNKQIEYLFFWGHTQKQEGVIDKFCFSQWFPASFTVEGVTYATAEHWMMAKKALLFNDRDQYEQILASSSPAKAKKCGRAVKNFDATIWNDHAYDFVVTGNVHKFSQHPQMKQFLLNTRDTIIVEASPFDKIWGIGTSKHEMNPAKWNGMNLLGFALMEARDLIKQR